MRILFIGGTGIISSACTPLAISRGMEAYLLCRGVSPRAVPPGARVLRGDIRDRDSARCALAELEFDAVVEWVAFTADHIETDIELFRGRTRHYVFISSASVYQTPPGSLPVRESSMLDNPVWQYSRDKIACEERLVRAYREERFPVTIVRPSHTYDATLLPPHGGYTVIDRMRRGKPVIVHGDGSSLWVLTHHRDFAKGLVGLLGLDAAIGEAFHITSDELLTWDRIHHVLARAAGTEARIVHVPSDVIARYDREWGDSLLGDKTHSMIFDNTKIKRFVPDYLATIPFSRGAEEIIAYHDADPARRRIDPAFDQLMDRIIADQRGILPPSHR
ncbi:MAG: NAD-dependent epimerase/dehydratase family protein [Polyangiaceae bacterium]|nr:NAD-dependent epimerase/dehydratase family protein [Polyangiaceae bacterium]